MQSYVDTIFDFVKKKYPELYKEYKESMSEEYNHKNEEKKIEFLSEIYIKSYKKPKKEDKIAAADRVKDNTIDINWINTFCYGLIEYLDEKQDYFSMQYQSIDTIIKTGMEHLDNFKSLISELELAPLRENDIEHFVRIIFLFFSGSNSLCQSYYPLLENIYYEDLLIFSEEFSCQTEDISSFIKKNKKIYIKKNEENKSKREYSKLKNNSAIYSTFTEDVANEMIDYVFPELSEKIFSQIVSLKISDKNIIRNIINHSIIEYINNYLIDENNDGLHYREFSAISATKCFLFNAKCSQIFNIRTREDNDNSYDLHYRIQSGDDYAKIVYLGKIKEDELHKIFIHASNIIKKSLINVEPDISRQIEEATSEGIFNHGKEDEDENTFKNSSVVDILIATFMGTISPVTLDYLYNITNKTNMNSSNYIKRLTNPSREMSILMCLPYFFEQNPNITNITESEKKELIRKEITYLLNHMPKDECKDVDENTPYIPFSSFDPDSVNFDNVIYNFLRNINDINITGPNDYLKVYKKFNHYCEQLTPQVTRSM